MKVPYVCGPLTDLPPNQRPGVKSFYTAIADELESLDLGDSNCRPFVPHEHFDPVVHRNFTPTQVYRAESEQICHRTSLLVVVAVAPSWGGGMEVQMAHHYQVPVVLLKRQRKKVSRLLLGCPAILRFIEYANYEHALDQLKEWYQSQVLATMPLFVSCS